MDAELVAQFRDNGHPDVSLTIAIPCTRQDSKWIDTAKKRYHEVLADQIFLVPYCNEHNEDRPWDYAQLAEYCRKDAYPYEPRFMIDRNTWMVDHSKAVIAVWDGSKSGGTCQCVDYATNQRKAILRIDPKTRNVTWLL